jgi:hypothetical protein
MRLLVLVLVVGCGRVSFDPLQADSGGRIDAEPASDASCACQDVHPLLDDFDRPDGAPGATWSGDTSVFAVTGDELVASGHGVMVWDPLAPTVVQTASVRYLGGSEQEVGVALDVQPDGDYAYVVFHETSTGSHTHVGTRIDDKYSDLGDDLPFVFAPGDRIGGTLHADGSIDLERNGAVIATYELPWPHAGVPGSIGLTSYYPGHAAMLDDFEGGACCE